MKPNRLGLVGAVLASAIVIAGEARGDTTYTYAGSLFTGFVTFNFDTSGVSGTFAHNTTGGITETQLTWAGTSVDSKVNFVSLNSFTLTDGAITDWLIYFSGLSFPNVICDFPFGKGICSFDSGGPGTVGQFGFPRAGDHVQQICGHCFDPLPLSFDGPPGTWSL
jgi:hypothetical protein